MAIRVGVRIRPLLQEEVRAGHRVTKLNIDERLSSITISGTDSKRSRTSDSRNYTFDHIMSEEGRIFLIGVFLPNPHIHLLLKIEIIIT
jgi:hypothetical protein